MDPVQFLKCILFFSLDRIIIYWNKLYDLRNLVGLPVWFVGPPLCDILVILPARMTSSNRACLDKTLLKFPVLWLIIFSESKTAINKHM